MKKETDEILGVFSTPEDTTTALTALKKTGHEKVALYSPFDPEEVDIPVAKIKSPVGWFTAAGALFGALAGLAFTVGTAILYPVETGGMPVLSLPAIAILSFDLMLLFAILFTIVGFICCTFFTTGRKTDLQESFSRDRFGISVSGDERSLASAIEVLKKAGADKVGKQMAQFCLALFMISALPGLVFGWPWSQDMVHQPARKAQSEAVTVLPSAVPRHRTSIEATEKAQAPWIENPTQLTAESLERGKILFDRFCVLCHGSEGKGDGIIAKKIGELPDFTKADFRDQPDGCIYFAITNGANFKKAVFPSDELPLEAQDDHHAPGEDGGHEHSHDEGLSFEDEHSHGDPMFAEDDLGHAHDEGLSLEDEHSHGDPMFTEDKHEHGGGDAHDDGHDHDHGGGGKECNSGHVHAPGEGHGDSGDDHGGGDDGGHGDGGHDGGGKKHFMPPHRDAIILIDRWHIVNYMKYELGQ